VDAVLTFLRRCDLSPISTLPMNDGLLMKPVPWESGTKQRSAEEVAKLPCCDRLPILIISQDPDRTQPGWGPQNMAERRIWGGLQEQMKSLSFCSRRIIARSSGHHVMIDRPEVIVRNVTFFLQHQAGTPKCPYNGGTEVH
jgi:hypothetical protein